jgi:hypothetical protein
MARELRPIDVSSIPELLRIAEEVGSSGESRVLRRDDEDLAVVVPLSVRTKRRKGRTLSAADRDAFLSAAGGWKGVDTDKLVEDIYASRRISDRPAINL